MDAVSLARWQFGATTVYHFFFVPLTIGLGWVVALLQSAWFVTGDDLYRRMTKFWGKLFLINFAMGVATGIVQEFQFGMNWSEYSRFVGDVFGAPLALEALLAFFLESTFLGFWIFGWDTLPKPLHLASIWLVALGATISAYFILVANSFMQQPVGYVMNNGRAEMADVLALITNPHVFVQFPHVVTSAMSTAAFVVMGISAWHLVRGPRDEDNREAFRRAFRYAAVYALASSLAVTVVGHAQAQYMMRIQPMKMSAAEALWNTESPAAMSLFTWGNERERRDVFAIKVPGLLSFLAYNRFEGEVRGINQLEAEYEQRYGPGSYVPPVKWTYWMFRAMAGVGVGMIGLAALAVLAVVRGRVERSPRLLWMLVPAMALPYIGNSTGWIFTEMGRQPWIVWGLMRTSDGISPTVGPASVLTSLLTLGLVYAALIAADVYLLRKFAVAGITPSAPRHDVNPDAASTGRV